jgi:hydroxypyruvate isomerase
MGKEKHYSRRSALQTVAGGLTGSLMASKMTMSGENRAPSSIKIQGNLKQSVCKWCYKDMSVEQLAYNASKIGLKSVELLSPEDWPLAKKYGLTCAMGSGAGPIEDGLNRKENHDRWQQNLRKHIELAAEMGIPNLICFSGNRNGMTDEEGLENCVVGIKPVLGLAEKKGVTICMELLNSKVDHKDYMCDHTPWGVELVKRVGSPRFKLLYDIYHMQIMEGDVIRTIVENWDYIAHFHTGGNPGRNEIDESQELNYTAICKAIVEKGFTGFIAQEFIPKRDPMTSLAQAFRICDV